MWRHLVFVFDFHHTHTALPGNELITQLPKFRVSEATTTKGRMKGINNEFSFSVIQAEYQTNQTPAAVF